MLRPAEMVKVYFMFHKKHLEDVLFSLQKLGCVQLFDVKEELALDPPDIEELSMAQELLGRVESLLEETKPRIQPPILEKVFGPRTAPLRVMKLRPTREILPEIQRRIEELEREYRELLEGVEEAKTRKKKVADELRKQRITLLREAFLGDVSDELLRRSRRLSRENAMLEMRLLRLMVDIDAFKKKNYSELLVLREEVSDLVSRLEAVTFLGATRYTLALGCWTPRKKETTVSDALLKAAKGEGILEVRKPGKNEDVPVLLENPRLLKPYEYLTERYGLPRYEEIDPTIFLAFTFTIFFGIIFADVGFGVTLALLSTLVLFKSTHWGEGHRNLNILLIYLGVASAVFGLIFGEFFGGLLRIQPLWRNPAEDILLLFMVTVGVGVLNIFLSIVLRLILNLRAGESVLYPVSLLLLICSGSAIAITGANIPAITGFSLGLLLLMVDKGYRTLDEIIALAANILSYGRIAVLYIVHVTVTKLLLRSLLGIPLSILGILFGVLLSILAVVVILVFDVFLIFITSLRLQWVEFFRRFYSGKGKKFQPFRAKREYIYTP
jgi:V/A-type H+-transporting ATPase subunit I